MIRKSLLIFLLIVGVVTLTGCAAQVANQETNNNKTNSAQATDLMSRTELTPEKIEVVHFHGNYQCWSCIMVGEYALKTIEEKFSEEYKNGTIVFKEINGELSANRDIVMKYQARGSSLFVNTIIDGKDKIEEDVTVWRFISNESQFMNYFENKLNKLLGK